MNNCFLYPEKESKYVDLLHKEGLRYEDIDAMTNEQFWHALLPFKPRAMNKHLQKYDVPPKSYKWKKIMKFSTGYTWRELNEMSDKEFWKIVLSSGDGEAIEDYIVAVKNAYK